MRHTRYEPHEPYNCSRENQYLGPREQLIRELGADILVGANPADHQTGGGRDDERRNLSNEPVADGEQSVIPGSGSKIQIVLKHTDDQATDHIDKKNQNSCYCIASHKLAGAIHGTVEFRFLGNRGATLARLFLSDEARR